MFVILNALCSKHNKPTGNAQITYPQLEVERKPRGRRLLARANICRAGRGVTGRCQNGKDYCHVRGRLESIETKAWRRSLRVKGRARQSSQPKTTPKKAILRPLCRSACSTARPGVFPKLSRRVRCVSSDSVPNRTRGTYKLTSNLQQFKTGYRQVKTRAV